MAVEAPVVLDVREPDPEGTDPAAMGTEALMDVLEAMPASPSTAMRVMQVLDSPTSSSAGVAAVVELDASLTARLLRLANSAYYSPVSAVTTCSRAIGLVGFSAVRAIAITTAAGLSDAEVPEGFWEHGAQTAHAASLLARNFGMKSNEAFSLGLLHDLGEGLMCTADREAWSRIEATRGEERGRAERRVFGMTHAEMGARLLRAWSLPEESVQAVARHHDGPSGTLADLIIAAETLVTMVSSEDEAEVRRTESTLRGLGIDPTLVQAAARRIEAEAATIAEALAA